MNKNSYSKIGSQLGASYLVLLLFVIGMSAHGNRSAASNELRWVFIAAPAVATLTFIYFCYTLYRKITQPLGVLTVAARAIAVGDLNFDRSAVEQLAATQKDEYGELADAMMGMANYYHEKFVWY